MERNRGYTPAMLDTAKVKALRERAGLTQAAASRAAGHTGRQWWNNIESGREKNIGLSTLNIVAKVLKTRARDLLKDVK